MTHRAALYAVTIHSKSGPREPSALGDYDEAGTWLGKALKKRIRQIAIQDEDRGISLRYESTLKQLPKHHVGFTLLRGQTGVTSVLSRQQEQPYYRTPETEESLRVAAVFSLPRTHNRGYLAMYVPHRRGIKTVFDQYLRKEFSRRGYVLSLRPIVPKDALRQALETNNLERITLVKRELSDSNRFADAARWGDHEVGRLELSIISKRGLKLRRDPLTRFLAEQRREDLDQIIEFNGMRFDEAKVTATMPGGGNRTFYLGGRGGGHAITFELELDGGDRSSDRMGILPNVLGEQLIEALSQLSREP